MSIDQSGLDKFEAVVESQRKRIMDMKAQDDFIDYSKLDKLIIGVCGGDGIGPMITGMAQHALEVLLADKVKAGKVEFRVIDGLTIERRDELGCYGRAEEVPRYPEGPHHDPAQGRSVAERRVRKRCNAQGSRPVCQRAPGKGAGAGYRLDVLP